MAVAKRTDANQTKVVTALRRVGCSVAILSAVGKGVPDILVGKGGKNYLMEIKDGEKIPSKRKLTPDEKEFHESWRGHVCIVESIDDALKIIA